MYTNPPPQNLTPNEPNTNPPSTPTNPHPKHHPPPTKLHHTHPHPTTPPQPPKVFHPHSSHTHPNLSPPPQHNLCPPHNPHHPPWGVGEAAQCPGAARLLRDFVAARTRSPNRVGRPAPPPRRTPRAGWRTLACGACFYYRRGLPRVGSSRVWVSKVIKKMVYSAPVRRRRVCCIFGGGLLRTCF